MAALYRRGGFGYGEVKKALADAAERYFAEARARREDWRQSRERVREILADGASRARKKAAEVLRGRKRRAGCADRRRMSRGMHFGPVVLWFVSAVAVAVAGCASPYWVQPHFAPVVIYPVLVGAVLGAAFGGLAVLAGVNRSRGILIAVVLLAVAASLLEHAFFYRDYRASFEQARERGEERIGFPLPEVEPETFGEYLRCACRIERTRYRPVGGQSIDHRGGGRRGILVLERQSTATGKPSVTAAQVPSTGCP